MDIPPLDPGGSVTRVSRESFGSRLKGAVGGLIAGGVLVVAAAVLLFLNEGRAVRRARALSEGAKTVVSLPAPVPDPALEHKLVHLSGTATTSETLRDPELGVEENAIRLVRAVEMYQWKENERTEERQRAGGGTEKVTTYTYDRTWSSSPIESASFQQPSGHQNPPFPIGGGEWRAERVTVGELTLDDTFVDRLRRGQALAIGEAVRQQAATLLGRPVVIADGGLYVGANPLQPQVGDTRIRFEAVRPALVSLVGQQAAGRLTTYETRNGSLALVEYDAKTADQMFASARSANRTLTWILRFAGFLAFLLGFGLLLRPIRVLADVVPFVGRVVGAGLGFVALGLAAICSLVTIAVGWFAYRPVLATVLFVLAVAVLVWLVVRARRAKPVVPPLPPVPAS
jgi:hypothetical protein